MKLVIWIALVLGAWLVASPFTIPYQGPRIAIAEDVLLGAAIIAFSLIVTVLGRSSAAWALVAFGAWVAVAPFVLGYYNRIVSSDAVANDIVVGSLVLLLALINLIATRSESPYTRA